MTTMISPFEGTSSSNRIEIGGKAISLAIIKNMTDWPTALVSQNLNLPSFVYQVPVLSMQKYPEIHHVVKSLYPIKISPLGFPIAGWVKHFAKIGKNRQKIKLR